MTDNASAGAMPAVADATPAQTLPETEAVPTPAATAGGEALGESGKRALEAERKSARDALKRAEAAEAKLKALEEDKLSETERAALKIGELERKLVERETAILERTVLASVMESASRLGFANPRVAFQLLDRSEIEYDEGGAPKNIEPLLKDLLKAEPYLASAHARPTGSIDGGTRGSPGLTLEQINRMTPEEHERRRDEVMAFLTARQRQ
jgi:hypothetical protein